MEMEKIDGFSFEGENEYGKITMTVEIENERIVVMNESHLGNTCVFNESEEKFDGEVQKLWEELQAQNLDDLAAAILRETMKNNFRKLNGSDTDWSYAADMFISWNCKKGFATESFNGLVEYMTDEMEMVFGNRTWSFFFGYGDDYVSFAEDWVDDDEKEEFLKYCERKEKEVKYFPFTIIGDHAEEAAAALEEEERNLDYLYDGIAPDRTGYEEARMNILAKIKDEFGVEIR